MWKSWANKHLHWPINSTFSTYMGKITSVLTPGPARQDLLLRLLRLEPEPLRPGTPPVRGVRPALPATGELPQYCAHRDPLRSLLGHEPKSRLGAPMGDEPRSCRRVRQPCMPNLGGRGCHRWRRWRLGSAATIGRINLGRFRLRGALTSGARGRVCCCFVASVQAAGGGGHCDYCDAG